MSTSHTSTSHLAKGKRPATEEAIPSPPMTRSRQRLLAGTEEPTAPVAPTGERDESRPVQFNEQGMLDMANTVDRTWRIMRGMDIHIVAMEREQQRAGQFHEDIMENIRDIHRDMQNSRDISNEREDMWRQQHLVNISVDRMGTRLAQLTQRIIAAEARAEAAEARAIAAEAAAAEALGLVNAVAHGNLEEVEESEPEEEPEEDPEEAPEEGPEEDDAASTVSSAHSAHP